MAHFARIDNNGIVVDLIVVDNDDIGGGTFPDSEPLGQELIANLPTDRCTGVWLQTSFSGSFRGRLGEIGFVYDADADAFVDPNTDPQTDPATDSSAL